MAGGEGLHTMVELVAALKAQSPHLDGVPGLWYRRRWPVARNSGSSRWSPIWTTKCPALPGICCPWTKYRAHNWHCLGRLQAPTLCRHLHDARLSLPLHLLLHPGPVQERREGRRHQGDRQQLPLLEPGHASSARSTSWSIEYGVRNIKIADEMFVLNAGTSWASATGSSSAATT